jgi:hypothetical protein
VSSTTAYPLCWPPGWPRTPDARRGHPRFPFKGNTFARARDGLAHELDRLGATDAILSTDVPLRLDGQPRGDVGGVKDPGVAVYFTLRGRQMAMARDEFSNVADNLRSLALAIEHLRGLERHGGARMVERAFAGFAALPEPGARRSPWLVLGLAGRPGGTTQAVIDIVEAAYRVKARQHHPDAGGSDAQMAEINAARDAALQEIQQ